MIDSSYSMYLVKCKAMVLKRSRNKCSAGKRLRAIFAVARSRLNVKQLHSYRQISLCSRDEQMYTHSRFTHIYCPRSNGGFRESATDFAFECFSQRARDYPTIASNSEQPPIDFQFRIFRVDTGGERERDHSTLSPIVAPRIK